jgi:hypothetical protein
MKLPIAFSTLAVAIGIMSPAVTGPAQTENPGDVNAPGTATTGIGTTSATVKEKGATPEGTPDESKTDESDDTLYRGKTTESENPMLRDEGPLHFKTHPKEKVQEVDSLKSLHSSSTDPKFQGSLLNSDVSAIEKISEKANETRDAADEGDPRFKTKRLTFTPDKNNESKKAQSDSSPSPTPSPTTSPAAKNSGETK